MNVMLKWAGALSLATMLTACGGGGDSGSDAGPSTVPAGVPVAPVAAVTPVTPVTSPESSGAAGTGVPVDAPDTALPVAGSNDAQASAGQGSSGQSGGQESAMAAVEVNAGATDDPTWVPTWKDADIDAYYPTRPIKLFVMGSGSVTSTAHGQAGPLCTGDDDDCPLAYSKYETVTLVAYPKAGMKFKGWSGGCVGAGMGLTCKITNSIGHTVLATFGPA